MPISPRCLAYPAHPHPFFSNVFISAAAVSPPTTSTYSNILGGASQVIQLSASQSPHGGAFIAPVQCSRIEHHSLPLTGHSLKQQTSLRRVCSGASSSSSPLVWGTGNGLRIPVAASISRFAQRGSVRRYSNFNFFHFYRLSWIDI